MAVECDLQRFYGLNLVEDIGTPALTWRRLAAFIGDMAGIPDSALARAQVKPEEAPWLNIQAHLMAIVADRLAVSNFLAGQGLVARGVYKQNPAPEPKPIPRPGVAEEPKPKRGLKAVIRSLFPAQAAKAGI